MAKSTSSEQRAQLIREMSKDMNRTRHSSGSSRQSQGQPSPEPTTSDFDPEHEAIMSTRQLDSHSQQLPDLRTSARKYSRFARPAEPDFAINTSAIGRAFPDFSRGGSSSDDDSASIELGRGGATSGKGTVGKLGRQREHSSNAQLYLDGDSKDFSAPMIGDFEVTGTPPLRQRGVAKQGYQENHDSLKRGDRTRKPSGLQNEMHDQSPPPAKTIDYGSGESRKGSGQSRRTLATMHARVQDEHDDPAIGEERPLTVDLTVRNTRFGRQVHPLSTSQSGLPTKFASAQSLMGSIAPSKKRNPQTAGVANHGTQQSFMLPDLPNISELISGVFEDGTPVFSRQSRTRASRFPATSQQNKGNAPGYASVNEIPVPDDEQAIFLSLKLLQDKVALLEKSNADAAITIDELQQKNKTLEGETSQKRRAPRNDSALGTTDSEDDQNIGPNKRKLLIERNRLEASVRQLQYQYDASNRKCTTAETILRDITGERDSAISQLGVAYVTIEQLKAEHQTLDQAIIDLKARLGHQCDEQDIVRIGETLSKEHSQRQRSDRQDTAANAVAVKEDSRRHGDKWRALNPQDRKSKTSLHTDANAVFDLSSKREGAQGSHHMNKDNESENSEDSRYESLQPKRHGKAVAQPRGLVPAQDGNTSVDLTYLSFLDNQEIAQLRRTLEQERIERNRRHYRNQQPLKLDKTDTQTDMLHVSPETIKEVLPKKSSMKDVTPGSTKHNDTTRSLHRTEAQPEHNRRHSDSSMLSTRSPRRAQDTENMTSAFIVPDITIRNPEINKYLLPKLTEENHKIVDELAKHSEHNCTVCTRKPDFHEQQGHGATVKGQIKITKPIPVSERKVEATEEGDPTIRPSQSPSLALAAVLKEFEDELTHLKIELAHYQTLYNGHDPALSKRKRKSLQQQMDVIVRTIDVKADQIYSLYDVLEGQKEDGRELSEEEVEITLQSIRLKAPELHLRGGGDADEGEGLRKPVERQPWDLESERDDTDGLPWEGIGSTVETTKSGFARCGRR